MKLILHKYSNLPILVIFKALKKLWLIVELFFETPNHPLGLINLYYCCAFRDQKPLRLRISLVINLYPNLFHNAHKQLLKQRSDWLPALVFSCSLIL